MEVLNDDAPTSRSWVGRRSVIGFVAKLSLAEVILTIAIVLTLMLAIVIASNVKRSTNLR